MRKFFIAATLVGAALFGTAAPSQASFIKLYLQQDGVNSGAITEVGSGADFTTASFTGTYGSFSVRVLGGASSNGATLSDLLQSTTSVTNNDLTSSRTLRIYLSQNDYTLPAGGLLSVESGLGGSVSDGTLGLNGIFQAYADSGNQLLGMSDFTNGPQSASQNGSTFDTGSARGTFARIGSYSLTTRVTLTMSAGARVNYSSHENVEDQSVVATPAPAGLVLAASGLPLLGFGTWLRRRKINSVKS